jgi:hypothetical protein
MTSLLSLYQRIPWKSIAPFPGLEVLSKSSWGNSALAGSVTRRVCPLKTRVTDPLRANVTPRLYPKNFCERPLVQMASSLSNLGERRCPKGEGAMGR